MKQHIHSEAQRAQIWLSWYLHKNISKKCKIIGKNTQQLFLLILNNCHIPMLLSIIFP